MPFYHQAQHLTSLFVSKVMAASTIWGLLFPPDLSVSAFLFLGFMFVCNRLAFFKCSFAAIYCIPKIIIVLSTQRKWAPLNEINEAVIFFLILQRTFLCGGLKLGREVISTSTQTQT